MDISDIRIHPVNEKGRMRAVVSVTFDNEFVIHDMKIIQGPERLFLAMPSRRTPENLYRDIAHPINAQARERLERAVLEKYGEQAPAAGGNTPATGGDIPATGGDTPIAGAPGLGLGGAES